MEELYSMKANQMIQKAQIPRMRYPFNSIIKQCYKLIPLTMPNISSCRSEGQAKPRYYNGPYSIQSIFQNQPTYLKAQTIIF